MNRNFRLLSRFVACLCIVMLVSTAQAWAAGPASEELRREAFMRGGAAITAALNAKDDAKPVSETVSRMVPSSPPPNAAPPQMSEGGMNKLLLTGLIAGFVVSGVLIYHYATGPGASVRNCSTCK